MEHPKHKQLHRCSQPTARVVRDEPSSLESSRLEIVSGLNSRKTDFTGVTGGPTRCVGGNPTRFQKEVHNSSRKSHEDLKSSNTLSVFIASQEAL